MDEKMLNKALAEVLATPSDVDDAWSDQCAQRLIGRAQLLDEQRRHQVLFRRRAGVCLAIAIIMSWAAVALPSVLVRTAVPVQVAAASMLRNMGKPREEPNVEGSWVQFWHRITLQAGGSIKAVSGSPMMHGAVRVYVDDASWLVVERSSGNVLGAVAQHAPLVATMAATPRDMGFSQLEQIRVSVDTALAAQGLSLQAAGLQQLPVYDLRTDNSQEYSSQLVFVRLAGPDGSGGAVMNVQTMRMVTLCDCSQASGLLITDDGVVVAAQ